MVLYRAADIQAGEKLNSPEFQNSFVLHADHLTFRYPEGESPTLADLSLRVKPGEFVAVLGPNACGKSTLVKLVAGLLIPSAGCLQVLGHDLSLQNGRKAILGRVGIVFQSPDEQMVAATLEQEVAFGLENLGLPSAEIRTRVDAVLDRFGLSALKYRSPLSLSGGEKQRLALASVLVMQPEILILDEVTSLLDPAGRREIRSLIRNLKGSSTVILITQFPEETLIADRLLVMYEGKIVRDATPYDVLSDTATMRHYGIDSPVVFHLLHAAECAEIPRRN